VLHEGEPRGAGGEEGPGGVAAEDEEHDRGLVASITSPSQGLRTVIVVGGCHRGEPLESRERGLLQT
jgi:hypothetical protein